MVKGSSPKGGLSKVNPARAGPSWAAPAATTSREPRQVREEATVAMVSCAAGPAHDRFWAHDRLGALERFWVL